MQDGLANNKRIAKNTLILYIRMLVMMAIGIFTSRVMLQILGVNNYGIQNVVGGFLGLFSIVTSSMSNAISRFIAVEIGKTDKHRLSRVFSTSITVQMVVALVFFILLEIIGVWYMDNIINIPQERFDAAMWVFHFAVIGSMIGLIFMPYHSCIIAHEKMNIFAWLSLLDVTFRLLILYVLYIIPYDLLKTYAVLGLIVNLIYQGINISYCRQHFEECRFRFFLDKPILKEMSSFVSWNFLGEGTWILNNQGISMLLNYHFGIVVNAAQGIANQLNQVVQKFVGGFSTSVTPQIYKTYAAGDIDYCFNLVCRSARFSYYLTFILALPVLLETENILNVWLVDVPENTALFARWTIAASLCITLGSSMVRLMLATGKIKNYQIIMSIIAIFPFLGSALLFMIGFPAETSFILYFIIYFLLIFVRIYLVNKVVKISIKQYLTDVVWRVTYISIIAAIVPFMFRHFLPDGFGRMIIVCITAFISVMMTTFFMGLHKGEQVFFKNQFKTKILRKEAN